MEVDDELDMTATAMYNGAVLLNDKVDATDKIIKVLMDFDDNNLDKLFSFDIIINGFNDFIKEALEYNPDFINENRDDFRTQNYTFLSRLGWDNYIARARPQIAIKLHNQTRRFVWKKN